MHTHTHNQDNYFLNGRATILSKQRKSSEDGGDAGESAERGDAHL